MDTLTRQPSGPPPAPPAAMTAGEPFPLGATLLGHDVNFAVFSAHATAVDLCLFEPDGNGWREVARHRLPARHGDVWHGRLREAGPGLVYGYRVHGPWRPDRGHRFNPHKLLLDPYARQIVGTLDWDDPHRGNDVEHTAHMDMRDNGPVALKARVVGPLPPLPLAGRPRHAPADTVLHEVHLRAFTMRHPQVPQALRGTYAGFAHPAVLAHLTALGITTVSLLPVQQVLSEMALTRAGRVNHWGYNTLGYFAIEPRYAADPVNAAAEFRAMVDALHGAGLEVLVDVVYNHTAEGDERGPTLCWRGLDNASYYRLQPHDRSRAENWSGCGNTLNLSHPRVMQMVLDSLRHWVTELGVDGFRFDLAPVLGRTEGGGFDRRSAFFQAVSQDPVLSRVKLVAEPWDLGPGGYQLGGFPSGWLEWNDRFRDTVRAFWLGGDCTRGELAQRLCASASMLQPRGRAPAESVNYVVSHDGFTLRDLVSYDFRHNQANGEDNRDGHGHNLSWNCGFEGDTTDPEVTALRARLMRALLATTLLAQGTPMLCAGSETGHTQRGNNNPYCQDNDITWLDWSGADATLTRFVARVLAIRRHWRPLGATWYTGLPDARGRHDLTWLRRGGQFPGPTEWDSRTSRVLGALIGRPGQPAAPWPMLLLFNAEDAPTRFTLPDAQDRPWRVALDSTTADGRGTWQGTDTAPLPARAVWLLVPADGPALPGFADDDTAA